HLPEFSKLRAGIIELQNRRGRESPLAHHLGSPLAEPHAVSVPPPAETPGQRVRLSRAKMAFSKLNRERRALELSRPDPLSKLGARHRPFPLTAVQLESEVNLLHAARRIAPDG